MEMHPRCLEESERRNIAGHGGIIGNTQWARNLKRDGGFLLWCVWMPGVGNDPPLVVAGQPLKVFSEGRVTSRSTSADRNCVLAEKRDEVGTSMSCISDGPG